MLIIDHSERITSQTTHLQRQNGWRSVDAHFLHGAVTASLSLLPIKPGDTLIMDISEPIASQTTYFQDQTLLTLCWRSFLCGAVTVSVSLLPIKAASTLVKDNSERIASELTHWQVRKSLTLPWCSFSESGHYRVAVCFAYKRCYYIDYGSQRANGFAIKLLTSPTIVDSPVTLTINMF